MSIKLEIFFMSVFQSLSLPVGTHAWQNSWPLPMSVSRCLETPDCYVWMFYNIKQSRMKKEMKVRRHRSVGKVHACHISMRTWVWALKPTYRDDMCMVVQSFAPRTTETEVRCLGLAGQAFQWRQRNMTYSVKPCHASMRVCVPSRAAMWEWSWALGNSCERIWALWQALLSKSGRTGQVRDTG